jgi:predicted transcriptional regulator
MNTNSTQQYMNAKMIIRISYSKAKLHSLKSLSKNEIDHNHIWSYFLSSLKGVKFKHALTSY